MVAVIQKVRAVELEHCSVMALPSLEGERARLMPLLSSIVRKQRAKKVNPKRERKKECEMAINTRRRRYL
jgi:hypothetical protein